MQQAPHKGGSKLPISGTELRLGYVGDGGLGEGLLREVMSGVKTATCLPLNEFTAEMLHDTQAALGSIITISGPDDVGRCAVRVTAVYETTAFDPAPQMLRGEGYGADAAAFRRGHYARRPDILPDASGQFSESALDALATLQPIQRLVVEMHDVLGWSITEIAQAVNCAPSVVRQALRRGRLSLARAPTGSTSCRHARRYVCDDRADWKSLPKAVQQHGDLCTDCADLVARLTAASRSRRSRTPESWEEAVAVERQTGRDPAAEITFVVVEFERA